MFFARNEVIRCQENQGVHVDLEVARNYVKSPTVRSTSEWLTATTTGMNAVLKQTNAITAGGERYVLFTLKTILCARFVWNVVS